MRIISWNIQWGRGADGRVDLDRTIAAIREMGSADVICLQEVARGFPSFSGARADGVVVLSEAFPEHEPVFAPGVDVPGEEGGRGGFGNLVLSAIPVGQVFRHLLPFPADPKVPGMQRACVEIVLHPLAGPLRVLTTHLEYYSVRQRRAQVRALRDLQVEAAEHSTIEVSGPDANPVFANRPRPRSAVVCGDFNLEPRSLEYEFMGAQPEWAGSGWVDAWRVVHGELPHHPTVGLHGAEWPDRSYCCDYFWVSEDLAARIEKVEVNANTPASDHQPILLVFDW